MNKNEVQNLIGELSKEQLVEVVVLMSKTGFKAEQALLDYCGKHVKEKDKREGIEAQKIGNAICEMWDSVSEGVDRANEYGGCSYREEDRIGEIIASIRDYPDLKKASWKDRCYVADGMLEQASYDNSGFTDILVEACMELCISKDEKLYLAERLQDINDYYRRFAANIYKECGDEDTYFDMISGALTFTSDYLKLANYYDEKGDHKTAVEVVWKGIDKGDGRLDWMYDYLFKKFRRDKTDDRLQELWEKAKKKKREMNYLAELLFPYYKKRGDYGKVKELLVIIAENARDKDIRKWYGVFREELNEADFKKEEARILSYMRQRSSTDYLDICLEKNEYDKVLEYLQGDEIFREYTLISSQWKKYAAKIEGKYPPEILDIYKKALFRATGSAEYDKAVALLSDVQRVLKKAAGNEEWEKFLGGYIEENRRKRKLIGMMKEKGYLKGK